MKLSDYITAVKVKEELEAILDDLLLEIKEKYYVMLKCASEGHSSFLSDFQMDEDKIVMYVKNHYGDTILLDINPEELERYSVAKVAEIMFARWEASEKIKMQSLREAEMKKDLAEYNRIKKKYNL